MVISLALNIAVITVNIITLTPLKVLRDIVVESSN